jgi:hypothetical protein
MIERRFAACRAGEAHMACIQLHHLLDGRHVQYKHVDDRIVRLLPPL